MPNWRAIRRSVFAVSLCALLAVSLSTAEEGSATSGRFRPMRLSYRVEWRLVTAGSAELAFTRASGNNVDVNMKLESAGLLSHLFRIQDAYHAFMSTQFCLSSAHLDAQEGKRHLITDINIDRAHSKSRYDEHDLIKNTSKQVDLEVSPCTYDVTGSIVALRELDMASGKEATLPITDGKKFAKVRIVAQGKDTVIIDDKKFQTVRYEAFMFDNVLYKRKGTLQIWVSDDAQKIPVQLRLQFGFPVGTVSVELVKEQDL